MAAGRKLKGLLCHVKFLLISEPREWAQRVSETDGLIRKVP